MEDLIPIETVLADMESDCGIVAEAAKDYLNIHRQLERIKYCPLCGKELKDDNT